MGGVVAEQGEKLFAEAAGAGGSDGMGITNRTDYGTTPGQRATVTSFG